MFIEEWTIKEIIQSGSIIIGIILGIIAIRKHSIEKAKVSAILENDLKHIKDELEEAKKDRRDLWTNINKIKDNQTELFGDLKYLKGRANGGVHNE